MRSCSPKFDFDKLPPVNPLARRSSRRRFQAASFFQKMPKYVILPSRISRRTQVDPSAGVAEANGHVAAGKFLRMNHSSNRRNDSLEEGANSKIRKVSQKEHLPTGDAPAKVPCMTEPLNSQDTPLDVHSWVSGSCFVHIAPCANQKCRPRLLLSAVRLSFKPQPFDRLLTCPVSHLAKFDNRTWAEHFRLGIMLDNK